MWDTAILHICQKEDYGIEGRLLLAQKIVYSKHSEGMYSFEPGESPDNADMFFMFRKP